MNWYERIEPEIREIVRELRNNGINTTGSCGHKMWIEGESVDLTADELVITNIMLERNFNFELTFTRTIKNRANFRRFLLNIGEDN